MKRSNKYFIPNFELRSVLLLSALALGAATAAQAQSTAAPQARDSAKDLDAVFVKADVNKDGKLDKKEVQTMPAVADSFEQLDANGDGFISREEFGKAAGS